MDCDGNHSITLNIATEYVLFCFVSLVQWTDRNAPTQYISVEGWVPNSRLAAAAIALRKFSEKF